MLLSERKNEMYKHLYDKFQNWYYNGSIYLYSDTHFSDTDLKDFRHNISDEEQVKRINSKLSKLDTMIFLGDVGNVEYIKKIKGYKVLIMGNHDSGASNYKRVEEILLEDEAEKIDKEVLEKEYRKTKSNIVGEDCYYYYKDNRLFDEVYEGPLFISDKILLSHEPIDFPYALNIHGHNHSGKFLSDDNHINVCAECIDYTPVNLKHIIEKGVLKNIDTIHRNTIDEAIERKKKKNEQI